MYDTTRKVSKCGVISGERYFVSLRIQSECGKYGPEITQYLDTFHTVRMIEKMMKFVYVVLDKILFQET